MPHNNVVISAIKPADFNRVALLESKLHDDAWQASALFELSYQSALSFGGLIASDNGALAGYLLWQCPDQAELLRLGVAKSHQRQGVAKHLMHQWLNTITTDALLEVSVDNVAAIALYQKMGFGIIHTRKNYYQIGKRYTDAYIMQKLAV